MRSRRSGGRRPPGGAGGAGPRLATLVVTGKDRVRGSTGCSRAISRRPAARGAAYGLVVARNGQVLADRPGRRRTIARAWSWRRDRRRGAADAFDHYLVMEDAEIAPAVDAFEPWAVHGPRTGGSLAAARAAGASGGILDRTGLGGALVLAPASERPKARGRRGRGAWRPADSSATKSGWEALRLERACRASASTSTTRRIRRRRPLEKIAVSFDKGCYLGQEVVCMLEMRGHVKRKLVAARARRRRACRARRRRGRRGRRGGRAR